MFDVTTWRGSGTHRQQRRFCSRNQYNDLALTSKTAPPSTLWQHLFCYDSSTAWTASAAANFIHCYYNLLQHCQQSLISSERFRQPLSLCRSPNLHLTMDSQSSTNSPGNLASTSSETSKKRWIQSDDGAENSPVYTAPSAYTNATNASAFAI